MSADEARYMAQADARSTVRGPASPKRMLGSKTGKSAREKGNGAMKALLITLAILLGIANLAIYLTGQTPAHEREGSIQEK